MSGIRWGLLESSEGSRMGKRAVDLPDPLVQPGQTPAQADDLISELAGEEIARLISTAGADNAKPGDRRGNSEAKHEPETQASPPADQEAAWSRADVAAQSAANSHSQVGPQLDEFFKTLD